ncbi:hypothetical protein ACVXHB_26385 [Escherichia coli]
MRTDPHQQPAPDPELQLQHHRQADRRSHHRSESGYRIPYATDPAATACPTRLHPDSTLSMWPDNRIARDAHYLYRYDRHGRLTRNRPHPGRGYPHG